MAVKRRVIWIDDADWRLLVEHAEKRGQNPSQLIRDMAKGGPADKAMTQSPEGTR